MSYSLKKPTRMREADAPSIDAPPITVADAPVAGTPHSSQEIIERVKNAFVGVFGRLEGLLGERWTGACDRLRERFPPIWEETEEAEKAVDGLSVAFINGTTTEKSFEEALERYERAWTSAASALATADRIAARACAECGREDLTVVVLDDAGKPFCRQCLMARS